MIGVIMRQHLLAALVVVFGMWTLASVTVTAQEAAPSDGPSRDSVSGRLETVRDAAGFAGNDKDTGLSTIIGGIIKAASSLLGVIFVAQMVYAGWLWMTARDEADQLDKAKHIIRRSIVGLAIVLGAWAITTFVITKFVTATT